MLINYLEPEFVNTDSRGSLFQLVSSNYRQVNYILSEANVVRGGHYHKLNNEAFYVINGRIKLILQREEEKEEYDISSGCFFMIPAGVKHTFEYTQQTQLISMYSNGVELDNGEKDIYR